MVNTLTEVCAFIPHGLQLVTAQQTFCNSLKLLLILIILISHFGSNKKYKTQLMQLQPHHLFIYFVQETNPMQAIAVSLTSSSSKTLFLFFLVLNSYFYLYAGLWKRVCFYHILPTLSCYASGQTAEPIGGHPQPAVDVHQVFPGHHLHHFFQSLLCFPVVAFWMTRMLAVHRPSLMWLCSLWCSSLSTLSLACRYCPHYKSS